jgi:hypothetical protein
MVQGSPARVPVTEISIWEPDSDSRTFTGVEQPTEDAERYTRFSFRSTRIRCQGTVAAGCVVWSRGSSLKSRGIVDIPGGGESCVAGGVAEGCGSQVDSPQAASDAVSKNARTAMPANLFPTPLRPHSMSAQYFVGIRGETAAGKPWIGNRSAASHDGHVCNPLGCQDLARVSRRANAICHLSMTLFVMLKLWF